jgi:hypothetical protein
VPEVKPIKEAPQGFAADFATLRDDITRLFSDGAAEVQNGLRGMGLDIETSIERCRPHSASGARR